MKEEKRLGHGRATLKNLSHKGELFEMTRDENDGGGKLRRSSINYSKSLFASDYSIEINS